MSVVMHSQPGGKFGGSKLSQVTLLVCVKVHFRIWASGRGSETAAGSGEATAFMCQCEVQNALSFHQNKCVAWAILLQRSLSSLQSFMFVEAWLKRAVSAVNHASTAFSKLSQSFT